ncbi:MAG: AAA family ATPase [bacterium]|nr:AAA family ATPase [bacterium]
MIVKLNTDQLAWRCPEEWLPWASSEDIEPASTIVGQKRAVDAIAFGLGMKGIGYNVFVTGLSGTGRLTTIKRFLDQLTDGNTPPNDVCYVYNFLKPEEPNALFLDAGAGRRLRDAMEVLLRELAENLPAIFTEKGFRERVDAAVEGLRQEEKNLVESFEEEVREAGFALVQIQTGTVARPEILPVVDEKPVAVQDLKGLLQEGKLTEDRLQVLEEQHKVFSERLHEIFQHVTELRQQARDQVEDVQKEAIRPFLDLVVKRVRSAVGDSKVDPYLAEVREDLEDHLHVFGEQGETPPDEDPFLRWRVNVAVDNADATGHPVVIETEPTFSNLFGTVERMVNRAGEAVTNFMRIRAGSLLTANGGYLVVNADDMLQDSRVWPALKRALKYERVQIQSYESVMLGVAALKPKPIPLKVKVVLIGNRSIYDALYRYDSDFPKVFKVLADFDTVMKANEGNVGDVLSVLRKVSVAEDLVPLSRSGMAAIIEEAVRMGRWRRRLSSRFSDLSDLLREASFLAERSSAEAITDEHVRGAQAAYRYRHGLSEDRTHELIEEGVYRIETDGSEVGQVNGLAVYDLGHHRYGKPSRISARIGLGREGIINVERQAGLSGPTHDKGIQILTGFLRGTFARKVPLSMSCSITFEQNYGGIDGDSASSTEIYAIISALSDVPLRQGVAVTGSVDQNGRVQSIGGANQKVEGFFRVCNARGLTGDQGVMIPASNVADLQLADDVVEAVQEGRFNVWSVDSIQDGIELLTGESAGSWSDDEGWETDSIYGRCQSRLEEMARLLRSAGKEEKNGDDDSDSSEENVEPKPETDEDEKEQKE